MAETCRSGDRNPRCAEPCAEGKKFCLGHQAVLDSVKANMRKKDKPQSIRKADTAPAPEADTAPARCRIVNCTKPTHDASTDGRSCWYHRITAPGSTVIENICSTKDCHRTATSSAGLCKVCREARLDGVPVAA